MIDYKAKKTLVDQLKEQKTTIEEYYKEKMKLLDEKIQQIEQIDEYRREDSFDAISYLVSKVEGEEYIWKEIEIPFWYDHIGEICQTDYILTYLVARKKEELVQKEMKGRIPIFKYADEKRTYGRYGQNHLMYFEWREDSMKTIENMLSKPSENYVQLSYCDKSKTKNGILYHKKNSFDTGCQRVQSRICDERYLYIVDYIDFVTEYKLTKPDYEVTREEMLRFADCFVESYKGAQTLEEKSANTFSKSLNSSLNSKK